MIKACKEHPYCIDENLTAEVPVKNYVPLPIPVPSYDPNGDTVHTTKFLQGVAENKFCYTGAQKEGTKTIPTQKSLDHYIAQQWNLDIDNMPNLLPDSMERV